MPYTVFLLTEDGREWEGKTFISEEEANAELDELPDGSESYIDGSLVSGGMIEHRRANF